MLLVAVVSSDIASAGYDPTLGEMQIQFTTGRIYSYAGVPPEIYEEFMNAPSKGSYFAQAFRRNPAPFPVTRIL